MEQKKKPLESRLKIPRAYMNCRGADIKAPKTALIDEEYRI